MDLCGAVLLLSMMMSRTVPGVLLLLKHSLHGLQLCWPYVALCEVVIMGASSLWMHCSPSEVASVGIALVAMLWSDLVIFRRSFARAGRFNLTKELNNSRDTSSAC